MSDPTQVPGAVAPAPTASGPAFNWDEAIDSAEANTFKVLPDDNYMVEIVKTEAVLAASSKNPMIKVQMQVLGGAFNGQMLFTNLVDSGPEGSRDMFVKQVMATGLTREWLTANNPSYEQIAQALVGRNCIAPTTIKQYRGEDKNEVGVLRQISQSVPGAAPVAPVGAVPQVPAPPSVPAPPTVPAPPAAAPAPAPVTAPVTEVAPEAPTASTPAPAQATTVPPASEF